MNRLGLSVAETDIIDVRQDRIELRNYLDSSTLRHSAVIAHADGLASEFIWAAQLYGHSVPGDIAIVGFDSTDFCEEIRPSLTSISQPLFDLGGSAARRLMKLIGGQSIDPLELVLPCSLDVRGSTLSPPSRLMNL
jgi:DNA-binding LacI/PurR family transcriptional regulator